MATKATKIDVWYQGRLIWTLWDNNDKSIVKNERKIPKIQEKQMNVKNNKSGFTLLEIIIVIIIVGVLASLALPRFFETIEFSRSSEAMNYIGAIKRGLETCALMSGIENWQPCDSVETAGLSGTPANAHFSYAVDNTNVTAPTTGTLTIVAQRTSQANGVTDDNITFTLNVGTNTMTRAGTTAFARIN